jgi:hypothetical protein
MHQEVSPPFVLFRFPRQDLIRRINDAYTPRLRRRRARERNETPVFSLWLYIVG